jgi:monofunctional biosynthetic peptidoglycan transglycosylase
MAKSAALAAPTGVTRAKVQKKGKAAARKEARPAPKAQAAPGRPFGRLLRWVVLLGLLGAGAVAASLVGLPGRDAVVALGKKVPRTTALMETRAQEAKEDGQSVKHVQQIVPLDAIAPELVACVLASEDARFFLHDGVDVAQIKQALAQDLTRGHWVRGASTLTQQLAKNLWLHEGKTPFRKLQEWVLASRLEDALSKERILEVYLNVVEWGDGLYGVQAASRMHFGKDARDLTLAESAMLAAMLPAPRKLSPHDNPRSLLPRAMRVLKRVEDEGLVKKAAAAAARAEVTTALQVD